MANILTIAGYTYGELASAFSGVGINQGTTGPVDGVYFATGEWGNPPQEGAPEYQDLEITLPGVDGVGIKRLGFRGRPIYARLAFVGGNKATCEGYKGAFFDAITQLASFSITVPEGTARPSCRIVHGSASQGQWAYMGGKFVLLVDVAFRQLRLV